MPQTPIRYMVVESIDLKTRTKTYKIFRRGDREPVVINLPTREMAEAKVLELEQQP